MVTSHLAREASNSAKIVDVQFMCDTLKSGIEAENDIQKYLPNISGKDAVGKLKVILSLGIKQNC